MTMPTLPVDSMCAGLTDCEAKVLRGAFLQNGKLRASKPFKRAKDNFEGCVNYVWRMLCFDFVASHPHSCMPVTADFDINPGLAEGNHDIRRQWCEILDVMITRAERNVPVELKAGLLRWGRAFGMI